MLLHEKLLLAAKVFVVACGVANAYCCVVAALLVLLCLVDIAVSACVIVALGFIVMRFFEK